MKLVQKWLKNSKKLTENSLKINWYLLKNRSKNGGNWIQPLQGTEGKSKIGWNLADLNLINFVPENKWLN